jgi:hypothetical protein
MSYPDLFKRAFALWWRTRALWPLGVLAAFFGAGDYAVSGTNFSGNVSAPSDPEASPIDPALLEEWAASPAVQAVVANPLPFLLGLLAIVILWTLIAILVGQLAHGAMIRLGDLADQGVEARLGEALRVGAARLPQLFLLGVIVALPTLLAVVGAIGIIVVVVVQLSTLTAGGEDVAGAIFASFGALLLCVFPLLLLVGLLNVALGLFARVAQRVCVIEGLGPVASLRRSWPLVTRNFGNTLLNWLATLMLGAIFGIVAGLPLLVLLLPALFGFFQSGDVPWGLLILAVVYSFLITTLVGGWLTSFNSALWTVLYRSFVARERAAAGYPAPYAAGD